MTPGDEALRGVSQRKRLLHALFLIGLCLLVLAASGLLGSFRGSRSVTGELSAWSLAASAGEDTQGVDSLVSSFEADVPSWFESELFSVDDAEESLASADGRVWGFVVEGDPASCFYELSSQMAEHGWSWAESGVEACATFVREEGGVRWALVSCSSVGDETAVVVQLA